jgi:nucleoside 2-deoxyribosyltransferase
MNKLRLYLSHTISIRKEVKEWEMMIEKELNIDLINPFYELGKRENIERMDKENSTFPYSYMTEELARYIVTTDLDAIDDSDGLVAYIKKPSFGTSMEIFYAKYVSKKPVYIYIEDQTMLKHPWLVRFSDHIYTDKTKLYKKLSSINNHN